MICPFCRAEMKVGRICGEGLALRWLPEDEELPLFAFSKKGIQLGSRSVFETPEAEAHYCGTCKKIVVDLEA